MRSHAMVISLALGGVSLGSVAIQDAWIEIIRGRSLSNGRIEMMGETRRTMGEHIYI